MICLFAVPVAIVDGVSETVQRYDADVGPLKVTVSDEDLVDDDDDAELELDIQFS